jgi:hypothetical protein
MLQFSHTYFSGILRDFTNIFVAFWHILVDQKPHFGYTSYTVTKRKYRGNQGTQTSVSRKRGRSA